MIDIDNGPPGMEWNGEKWTARAEQDEAIESEEVDQRGGRAEQEGDDRQEQCHPRAEQSDQGDQLQGESQQVQLIHAEPDMDVTAAKQQPQFSLAAVAAALESDEDVTDIDMPIANFEGQGMEDPLSGSEFFGWSDDDDDEERIAQESLKWIPLLFPDHAIFSVSIEDISVLKNKELQAELKSRGLTTSGNKSELQSRLQEALQCPFELNVDRIRIQSGEFDSESDGEDIGIIMARKMKKIKPDVEERRKKVWDLLEAGMSIKDICLQTDLDRSTVQRIRNLKTGGQSAKYKFMRM